MRRFRFGRLPPARTGDPESVRLHRRAPIAAGIVTVSGDPTAPCIALSFWVLYS